MNITLLGAGSWAIALSVLLNENGHSVTLWEFSKKDADLLKKDREHKIKLPGVHIPESINIETDISKVIKDRDLVVIAIPTQFVRSGLEALKKNVSESVIDSVRGWVIVAKGIECGTNSLLTEVVTDVIPHITMDKLVALSGPSHAEEVGRKIPTTVVAASTDIALAKEVQSAFSSDTFRVYTNGDITGVELAGAVKNVIALAAGVCDGLGFGDNTKGALLTRGMVEMARLGKKMGADEHTFSGLAGFGDLITTCFSKHSRNRQMGELLATGISLEEALSKMTMVAEGVTTAKSVYSLSQKIGIDMPITTEIYKALYEDKSPHKAVMDLMGREVKAERY
jgi:glycerol-3-phosphate dehydrogenase (NAD(P)+)